MGEQGTQGVKIKSCTLKEIISKTLILFASPVMKHLMPSVVDVSQGRSPRLLRRKGSRCLIHTSLRLQKGR